jgi:hypothetical protein
MPDYLWDHRRQLAGLVDLWEAATATTCSR